ncbi:carboxypeptidase-like regulatory domain-containing protein [Candidatus Dojkabacteria bacterium]|nr:carboxypeptidase-like regulatory domain-containing protein [Candidatus Dojkabacteria bacterium]
MKIVNGFLNFLKLILILGAFAYVVLSLYTVVFDYSLVLNTFFELTGINGDYFLTDVERGPEEVASLYDTAFYNVTYALSSLAAVLGMIILSRRRTLIEAAGLLLGFIIPPERKSWGRILDSSNANPIPFAQIYLEPLNAQRKVIKTIADSDGRYKLILPDRKYGYNLLVKAPGYKDLKKEIRTSEARVYGSEYIKDVFLHQIGKSERKLFTNLNFLQSRMYWYLILLLAVLSFIYFIFALYYVYAFPGSAYGAVNLALFVFALGWNIVMVKDRLKPRIGKVLDLNTRKPIGEASVYLYRKEQQLEVRRTDSVGVVNFSIDPGDYEVRLAKTGYQSASENTFQKVKVKRDGYLDTNLFMKKADEYKNAVPASNPFS